MERVCCEFKYSGLGFAFLAAAVAGTLALVIFVAFPDEARALAFALVVASASRAHRRLGEAGAMVLEAGGAISVRDRAGSWLGGELREGCFVAPWLAIVRWRPQGARRDRTLVILPDMIQVGTLRQIRVILRWA